MAPHTAWALQTVILCDMQLRGEKSLAKMGKPPWVGDCSLTTGFSESTAKAEICSGSVWESLGLLSGLQSTHTLCRAPASEDPGEMDGVGMAQV